jgi:hypothetical protein
MNFNLPKSIELLARTPQVYKALLLGLEYNWDKINEGESTWSAFDILGHLIHGEKIDWIPRAKLILNSVSIPTFKPFDRFAQAELNKNKTTNELLIEFESFRVKNLKTLKSWNLTEVELSKQGIHPDLGLVTLKQLISTWTIHDMGHLNQLSRVLVKHYKEDVGPWSQYSKILINT